MIICDIDGTVAIRNNRGIYEFDKSDNDFPNVPIVQLIQRIGLFDYIVWITSRPEKYRDITAKWLSANGLPSSNLHMRSNDDYTESAEYKRTVWESLESDASKVWLCLDDREDVAKMWRSIGVTCLQVANDPRFQPRLNALSVISSTFSS